MRQPPDDRIIAARIGLNEPTGIALLHRVEEMTDEFDRATMRWRSTVRYELPELLRLPGGMSQATIADAIAELVGEAHAEPADRVSTVVDISACGLPFMRTLRHSAINCGTYETKAGAQPSEKPQSRVGDGQIRAVAVVVGAAVKPRSPVGGASASCWP